MAKSGGAGIQTLIFRFQLLNSFLMIQHQGGGEEKQVGPCDSEFPRVVLLILPGSLC